MAEHKFKIRWPEAKLERKAGMVSAATRGHLASNCMFALKIDHVEGLTKNKLNYQQLVPLFYIIP
jgi:hypothetical protein